jgi:hypothetical protein
LADDDEHRRAGDDDDERRGHRADDPGAEPRHRRADHDDSDPRRDTRRRDRAGRTRSRASGLGSRHGANGIRKYCKVQSLLVTRRALKREPFMLPYRAGRTQMRQRLFRFLYGRRRKD